MDKNTTEGKKMKKVKVNLKKVPVKTKVSGSTIVKTLHPQPVKWTNVLKLQIAEYIKDNYPQYKIQSKMVFSRKMRDDLKISCTEKQLKNFLHRFCKVYTDIKTKLNSSGFGVDFEIDKSLDKGWIYKQCPYYDILDEVMSTRPNITPPFILESTSIGEIGLPDLTDTNDEVTDDIDESCEQDNQIDSFSSDSEEMQTMTDPPVAEPEVVNNKAVEQSIQKLFTGIGVAKTRAEGGSAKNSLSTFSQILSEKMTATAEVETQKHELEKRRFDYNQTHDTNLLDMERDKLQVNKELSLYKINSEKEVKILELQDKKEERQFELRKLELLIQLEKEKQKT